MTIALHPDTRHDRHEDGLDHAHDWAREGTASRHHGPHAADAGAVPTPSSAVHDDAIYAAL